jgi:hypothetical protein
MSTYKFETTAVTEEGLRRIDEVIQRTVRRWGWTRKTKNVVHWIHRKVTYTHEGDGWFKVTVEGDFLTWKDGFQQRVEGKLTIRICKKMGVYRYRSTLGWIKLVSTPGIIPVKVP